MQSAWVEAHKHTVQKPANAFVKTLKFINSHSAGEIAAKMPMDFYVANEDGYVKAPAAGKAMFTPDGVMPEGAPRPCWPSSPPS
jgi:sulfonate transport system substrate-binding protein